MAEVHGLQDHLAGGQTTTCHCWLLERRDGRRYGFTDHDGPLHFEGIDFRPESGLAARALVQSTGLAVDNSEALGALSDAAIGAAEIEQGRFDGAEVTAWLVNWADPAQREVQFRGTLGEILRAEGHFRAELRGLTEGLNRPLGRVYQKPCTAVLGDADCGVDLAAPGMQLELAAEEVVERQRLSWGEITGFDAGWFAGGWLEVLEGPAAGLKGLIREDRSGPEGRSLVLWAPIRGEVAQGTLLRLTAGCDRRAETCRLKFDNLLNFRGFPDLPGEDWVMAVPKAGGANGGGSRR
jgi:uncharacterized phage protein (TIGR02218 family)